MKTEREIILGDLSNWLVTFDVFGRMSLAVHGHMIILRQSDSGMRPAYPEGHWYKVMYFSRRSAFIPCH